MMGEHAEDFLATCDWFNKSKKAVSQPVTCKFCKTRGFFWKETENGWRLTNRRGEVHSCGLYRKEL